MRSIKAKVKAKVKGRNKKRVKVNQNRGNKIKGLLKKIKLRQVLNYNYT